MVFNWFKKDTTGPGQSIKEAICKEMLEKSNELIEQSQFFRLMTRSLRAEITDTMISNASTQNPDIEKRIQDIKDKIESARKTASSIRQSPNDVTGEFRAATDISKDMKNLAQEISCLGSRTERKLYADCPNNRVFIESLKEKLNEKAESFRPPASKLDDNDAMHAEVSEKLAGVTLKRMSEKYMGKQMDRYKRAFSAPDFFLRVPGGLEEEFKSIDRQQVKAPPRTISPLPRHEKANESEMRKIEEAMGRITESENEMLKEIADLKSVDGSEIARKDRLARDQRLASLESTMKEKEEQLKKADERLERMRLKNDHLGESNTKVNEQNANAIERFCAELDDDLQQLTLAYETKRKTLDELVANLAAKVKGSRHRGLISLVRVRERVKKSHESARPGDDINNHARLKRFLEAKTTKELGAAYEAMEGERLMKFSQAMVLRTAVKAGGIEELIGYCAEDAVVDVLKARSPGVPRKVIKEFLRSNPPPELRFRSK